MVITSLFCILKVFYVPLRNEFGENNLHTNQDLTKRFDEDLSNKHLIVVCRNLNLELLVFFLIFILDIS